MILFRTRLMTTHLLHTHCSSFTDDFIFWFAHPTFNFFKMYDFIYFLKLTFAACLRLSTEQAVSSLLAALKSEASPDCKVYDLLRPFSASWILFAQPLFVLSLQGGLFENTWNICDCFVVSRSTDLCLRRRNFNLLGKKVSDFFLQIFLML